VPRALPTTMRCCTASSDTRLCPLPVRHPVQCFSISPLIHMQRALAQVPEYFAEDLFSVLGDQRPDYRWLIIGPKKAGSSFHKVMPCFKQVSPSILSLCSRKPCDDLVKRKSDGRCATPAVGPQLYVCLERCHLRQQKVGAVAPKQPAARSACVCCLFDDVSNADMRHTGSMRSKIDCVIFIDQVSLLVCRCVPFR
jgi:hypothetical protein